MIYELGPNELGEEPDGAIWTVAYYETGDYEGSGEAVSFMPDQILEIHCLSHCSCYGPLDGSNNPLSRVSVDDFLAARHCVLAHCENRLVEAKVFELLDRRDYE